MIRYVWSLTETPCPEDYPVSLFMVECYRSTVLTNYHFRRLAYLPFAITDEGELADNMANLIRDDGIAYERFFEELGRSRLHPNLVGKLLTFKEQFVSAGSGYGLTFYYLPERYVGPVPKNTVENPEFANLLGECRRMLDSPARVYVQ